MSHRLGPRRRWLRGNSHLELLEPRYFFSAGANGWDVALIDRTLPQAQTLINAALGKTHIITYDGAHDSPQVVLQRIVQLAISGGIKIASLSLLSHGAAGTFELGNQLISSRNVDHLARQLGELRQVFSAGATLQIYSCDTADGISGQKLLNQLARYTGAAVFGSTNITGYGGDWTLEAASAGAQSDLPRLTIPFNTAILARYSGTLGTLSGSGAYTTNATVNLTTTGTSDWIHWGNGIAPGTDRKATGGSQISDYTLLPGTTAMSFSGTQRAMSWTDGSPHATHTETNGAGNIVYVSGSGHGFSFTVPADTQQRTLMIYVSAQTASGGGTFTATLSDGSAAAYVDNPTFATSQDRTYTINFSANSPGQTLTIVFKSNGTFVGISGAALIGPPTIATAASASPNPVIGSTTNLSVLGAGGGGESNLTYTWATTGTPPAAVIFSANGTNAAKNTTATFSKAGTYNFQVTVTDSNGLSTTSSVSVTVNQTVTSIVLSPASASLNWNGTQQFSATARDQFGSALLMQPALTWAVSSGIGTVSSSGLYTAPAANGSATVRASSGGVSGTASVTVTNAAPTIAAPASATPNPVSGTSTSLSVLGADDGSESNLIYTWAILGTPPAPVTFSANATNAAKNATATLSRAGTYNFQVTVRDAGGLTTTSGVTVTVSQTLTNIVVSPGSAALNEDQTQQFSATALDQFGNALLVQPAFTWSVPGGAGTVDGSGLYTAPAAAGAETVRATGGAVSGDASVTITNAAPTVATAAGASPNPVSGTSTSLSVLGTDDGGEANLTYTWATTGSPPAPVTLSDNGTNSAKSTTATFTRAGTYSLVVTITDSGGLTTTSSVTITVDQTLSSVSISPVSVAVNLNGTQQFTATGLDQFGQALATQPGFNWSVPVGGGSVDASGLYTAPNASGSATVRATTGGFHADATVTVSSGAPTVAMPASASPNPVTGTTTSLSVLGADDGGESNLTYTWSLTSSPPASVIFSDNGTNSAKNATATFTSAGTYHFLVTITDSGGLSTNSTVNVTVNQTLSSIEVTPASASVVENSTLQFTATACDQFDTPMLSQPAFSWSASGPGAIDGSGLYTAPGAPGSVTIFAHNGGITGSASVTVTTAPPTVATPANASPNPVAGTTTNLSVLGADDGGEGNLTYAWSLTGSPPAAVIFSANGTNAAKNSTATFARAGTYNFLVTITDADGLSTTSTVSVTVNQTLAAITVAPGTANLNENATQTFTTIAYDQFGNAMIAQPAFTWTKTSGIGSIDAAGLYSAPAAAGSASVRANAGPVSGSASITITNAAPVFVNPAAASPTPVTSTATGLSALGADDGGEANLTYTWTLIGFAPASVAFASSGTNAAKNTVATFTQAGTYTFRVTATDSGGLSATSSVTVNVVPTLASIAIAPASASISENQSQLFSAVAYDQFGKPISTQPVFAWSAVRGSIDSSGTYTAPRFGGSDTVTAASGSVTGTAFLTVTNTPPVIVSQASASTNLVTTTTTLLQVLADDDGGEAALSYQWSVISKPAGTADPAFSTNAANAAKSATATFFAAGDYAFRVAVSDGTYTTFSDVTVSVIATLTRISVIPSHPTVIDGGATQFVAVAYDQFGNLFSNPPAFSWSIAPANFGTISADGQYAAPAAGVGRVTLQASAGSVMGQAIADVISPAPVAPPAPAPAPLLPPPVAPPGSDVTATQSPSQPPSPLTGGQDGRTLEHGTGAAAAAPAAADASVEPQAPDQALAPAQAPPTATQGESGREGAPSNPPGSKEQAPRPAPSSVRAPTAVAAAERLAHVEPKKLYTELDTVAKEVQASRGVFGTTIQPGTIVTTTVTMSAGIIVWLTRGSSLLMSLLSALPIWRLLDPLPILESWEQKRRSEKSKKRKGTPMDGPDDQEQRVRSLVEPDTAKGKRFAGR